MENQKNLLTKNVVGRSMVKLIGISFFFLLLTLVSAECLYATEEKYPTRPISFIMASSPGSGYDLSVRVLTEYLSEYLGQPVVTVSKPGGQMLIGGNAIATANPDGYTIGGLIIPASIPEVYRYFQEPPYSSTDLKPICRLWNYVGVVVVKGDAPWKNFKEVVEYVRKNPGMKFGIFTKGGFPHLLMLGIEKAEKVSFTYFTNNSDMDMVINIMGGHIPIGLAQYSAAKPQLEAGLVKGLAAYAATRAEFLPQVPTVVELGYEPGPIACLALFAPKGTPDSIIRKISDAVKRASEDTLFRQKSTAFGYQVAFEDNQQYQNTLTKYKIVIENNLRELGYVKK